MRIFKFLLAGLLLMSDIVQAEPIVIKPVTIGDNQSILTSLHTTFGSKVAFAGDRLVFLSYTPSGDGSEVRFWSTDGTNPGTVLLSESAISARNELLQFNGQVYFMAKTDALADEQLWVTDGTPDGTRAIADTVVDFGRATVSGGAIYIEDTINDELLVTDGQLVQRLVETDLTGDNISVSEHLFDLCGFAPTDFVNWGRSNDANVLVRYQDGVLTDVSSDALSFQLGGVNRAIASGDSCFFTVRGEGQHQVLRVRQDGQVDEIQIPGDISKNSWITESFGEVFAYRVDSNGVASSIVRLDDESTSPEVVLEDGLAGNNSISLQAFSISRDFIYGRYYAGLLDPPGSSILAIDRTTGVETFTGITPIDFQTVSIDDRELIIPFTVTQFNTSTLVDFYQQGEFVPGLNLHDIDIKSVYRDRKNPDNTKVFFRADGVAPGAVSGLYTIDNQPSISSDVAGLWAVEGIPSQGLVIQAGMSETGSRYLFVGVFSQAEGQPYWLAGNADFSPGDDVITMDLLDIDGGNFFDDQAALPSSEVVGQLTLSRSSCNGLSATFNMNDQSLSRTVTLGRLANTLLSRRCVEE